MVKLQYALDDDRECQTVDMKFGQVSYHLAGPEDGPLVVCLHGVSGFKYQFRELSPCLARQGFRVLTFDFYGRGYSATPSVSYDLSLYVQQTIELLRALGLSSTKMVLVGYSLGGAIAVGLAEAYPSMVQKLVLVAPAGLDVPGKELAPLMKVPLLGKVLRHHCMKVLKKNTEGTFFAPERCPELLEMVRDKLDHQMKNKAGYKDALMSTLTNFPLNSMHESFANVGRHRRPVLVIWGREDNVTLYTGAEYIKEKFGNCELVTMEKAGHMVLLERASELNSKIGSFVSKSLTDDETEPNDMKSSLSAEDLVATAGLNFCVS